MTGVGRTSVIAHPQGSRFLVVRPHYAALTGNGAAAAVLSVLEGWTNWHCQRAEAAGELPDPWLRLPMKQLIADACDLYGRRALETGLDKLIELGFIERRESDDLRDRTLLWRLDVDAVNAAISRMSESPSPAASGVRSNSASGSGESAALARASESGLKELGKESTPAGAGAPEIDPEVADVWAYWCERRQPRRRELEPSQAKLIVKGLKVATVVELKRAIDELLSDEWHRERGLLNLSTLLATRPGGPTLRDQIDRWLDKAQTSTSTPPSTERASLRHRGIQQPLVDQWINQVRNNIGTGLVLPDFDEETKQSLSEARTLKRTAAIEELQRMGIATSFDANGRPTFRDVA